MLGVQPLIPRVLLEEALTSRSNHADVGPADGAGHLLLGTIFHLEVCDCVYVEISCVCFVLS